MNECYCKPPNKNKAADEQLALISYGTALGQSYQT
jgi:hypothetical protein